MTNHVLTNFRDHPSLRHDDPQSVFKIDGKVYLISGGVVQQIFPTKIARTNIGEPYRDLVRLYFQGEEYEVCIDFAPEHEEALRQLLN